MDLADVSCPRFNFTRMTLKTVTRILRTPKKQFGLDMIDGFYELL